MKAILMPVGIAVVTIYIFTLVQTGESTITTSDKTCKADKECKCSDKIKTNEPHCYQGKCACFDRQLRGQVCFDDKDCAGDASVCKLGTFCKKSGGEPGTCNCRKCKTTDECPQCPLGHLPGQKPTERKCTPTGVCVCARPE